MATICDFVSDDGTVTDAQAASAQQANDAGELSFDAVLRLIEANNEDTTIQECVGSGDPDLPATCISLLGGYWPVAVAAANDQGVVDNAGPVRASNAASLSDEQTTAVEQMAENRCELSDVVGVADFIPRAEGGRLAGDVRFSVPGGVLFDGTGYDVNLTLSVNGQSLGLITFRNYGSDGGYRSFGPDALDVQLPQGDHQVCPVSATVTKSDQ